MKNEEIELGDLVECKLTGMKGIANGIAKWMTGCDRVSVQPPVDKDGKYRDGYWLDKNALKIIKKAKVKIDDFQEKGPEAKRGGPASKDK